MPTFVLNLFLETNCQNGPQRVDLPVNSANRCCFISLSWRICQVPCASYQRDYIEVIRNRLAYLSLVFKMNQLFRASHLLHSSYHIASTSLWKICGQDLKAGLEKINELTWKWVHCPVYYQFFSSISPYNVQWNPVDGLFYSLTFCLC